MHSKECRRIGAGGTTSTETFIGWAIDRDYLASEGGPTRVGYGMTLGEAAATADSLEMPFARQIHVRADLTTGAVADPVRFRLLDDDGEIYYGGAITAGLLTGEGIELPDSEDDDIGYLALKFGEADAGCTDIQFKASDLRQYAGGARMADRHEEFERGHVRAGGEIWITPYG